MKLPPFMHDGYVAQLGSHRFSEEEILRFARKYDPQPFHVDKEAAKASLMGGLCASGWHTAGVWMRKQRDHSAVMLAGLESDGYGTVEYGPSGGFRNLKWPNPVRVGDTVAFSNITLSCRQSASRPGWHVLSGRNGGINQDGKPVLEFESMVLLRYSA
jgi:acyl dehydratase